MSKQLQLNEYVSIDAEQNKNANQKSASGSANPKRSKNVNGGQAHFCPIYETARHNDQWRSLVEEHSLSDVECGHFIEMIVHKTSHNNITISSAKNYARTIVRFLDYCQEHNMTVTDVEINDIHNFFSKLEKEGIRNSYAKKILSVIKSLIRHIDIYTDMEVGVKYGVVEDEINIGKNYNFKSPLKKGFLDKEEIEILPEHAESKLATIIIKVGIVTGQRKNDLVKIKISQVNLEEEKIELQNTKAGGTYELPLPKNVVLSLRHYLESERKAIPGAKNNDYLFPNPVGGDETHISGRVYAKMLDRAAENAGIQYVVDETTLTDRQKELYGTDKDKREFKYVTPHSLRRSLSQLLIDYSDDTKLSALALDDSKEIIENYYKMKKEDNQLEELRKFYNQIFDK